MKKIVLSSVIVLFLVGCKQAESVEVLTEEKVDYTDSKSINPEFDGKVFKSNAMITMGVSDVFKVGNEIEKNAVEHNGFVLSNKFYTQLIDSENVKISDDSLKVIDKIQKNSSLVLKVPVQNLKSHLKFSFEKGLIINSIEIENEELTFKKLSNDLQLLENSKLKSAEKIEEKVTKAVLTDDVKYATISYQLNQSPSIIMYNSENTDLDLYQDINLGLEIKKSLKDGFYFFKMFLLFIVKFLPTLAALSFVIVVFKYAINTYKSYKNK